MTNNIKQTCRNCANEACKKANRFEQELSSRLGTCMTGNFKPKEEPTETKPAPAPLRNTISIGDDDYML